MIQFLLWLYFLIILLGSVSGSVLESIFEIFGINNTEIIWDRDRPYPPRIGK